MKLTLKEFNLLRRGALEQTRFDYGREVGDGLRSPTIVAPALWVARQFPEARLAVRDPEGELLFDHPLVQLINNPNEWYGGGTLKMALALDYAIRGNAFYELERGRGGRPERLYYQPSYQIQVKGTGTELVTHYLHSTEKGQRRIELEDMGHFRLGLDPNDHKMGISPLYSLLREVFTDDEAGVMTAAILRNLGVPGLIISAANPEEEDLGPKARSRIKEYFKKTFRGSNAGEALVLSGQVKLEQLNIDLAKMGIDRLRQIPEERVCAVMGIPAAVVGFGTGLEQTKVGATMKELRELAYENFIIPMQRVFAEELNRTLLPEFETRDNFEVVFDNSEVRVLQEDENRKSDRIIRQWQGGLISRAEGRQLLGHDVVPADEVYRQGMSDVYVPVGTQSELLEEEKREPLPEWVFKTLKGAQEDRDNLFVRFLVDRETLAAQWSDEVRKSLEALGDRAADLYMEYNKGKALDVNDEEMINAIMAELGFVGPDFEAHYLRVLRTTTKTINGTMGLGVMLDAPMERRVMSAGGTRKGLIDFDDQTRTALFNALSGARAAGAGPVEIARMIREMIPAGPWSSVDVRAAVISRTETKWAQNVSSMEVYQKADNVTHIQIYDARIGDQHDDRCIELDGQIVTVQEAGMIDPLEHPNCSRSFAPVVNSAVEV